jgi:DNA polymerase V
VDVVFLKHVADLEFRRAHRNAQCFGLVAAGNDAAVVVRQNHNRLAYKLRPEKPLAGSADKKSIATTRSFPKKLTDFDPLRERVSTFASVCAEKLRNQHSCCQTIVVLLGTLEHKTAHSKMYYQDSVTLPFATNSALTIADTVVTILAKLYEKHKGLPFHKAGVIVTQLIREDEKQFNMFEDENPKHLALMKAVDKVNKKQGGRLIRLGAQDDKTWNMKQEKLSPRYTTQFDEILTIKCR